MVEKSPRRQEQVTSYPPVLTDAERSEYFNAIVAPAQKQERDNIGRDKVEIKLATNDPIMLICVSDLHIGSVATDYEAIKEIFDFVAKTKNAKVVLLGDEIEGTKEKYMNTNVARILGDTESQKNELANYLRPLVAENKIAGMVSNYWGHNGWEEDAATTNPWLDMADRIGMDRERVIKNGGRIDFVFPNGYKHSETIWHNPPGKSKIETVFGLRNAAFATSESNRTDGFMSGHIHKMGVGKEIYSGGKAAVYYISSGTAKGSSTETPPDRFGIKLGAPLTDPMGQGAVIEPRRKSKKELVYPFPSLRQGKIQNDALQLLDRAEKLGMTEELLQKIHDEVEKKPKIILVEGKSRVSGQEKAEAKPAEAVKVGNNFVKNPYSNMEMRAPYDSLTYRVESKLPVTLYLQSNARIGSSSEGYEELKRFHQEQIQNDPYSLVVFLRNMIDKDAGKLPQRMEILNKFAEIINGSKEQTLAIMMCESLRSSAWGKNKVVGYEYVDQNGNVVDPDKMSEEADEDFDEEDDEEGGLFEKKAKQKIRRRTLYSMPIAPGSYLSNKTDTPLIRHLSLIQLSVGPKGPMIERPMYSGLFADKLLKHGSYSRPEFGLKRMYDLYAQEKPGFVAGGHMPHAGSMIFYDGSNSETKTPILIAPGWYSKYVDSMGKGNVMPGAEPGQAIIFLPGIDKYAYDAFPMASAEDAGYMKDALTMEIGSKILGLREKIMGRKRR